MMIIVSPQGSIPVPRSRARALANESQDASKGGAVETGCSDLYDVI